MLQPEDIRRLLIKLDKSTAEEYPLDDLQPTLTVKNEPCTLEYVMTKDPP